MDRALKPATYRSKEMQTIARWILAGESGSVVGLAGCGRSNLGVGAAISVEI
jgi:hypothetical protein